MAAQRPDTRQLLGRLSAFGAAISLFTALKAPPCAAFSYNAYNSAATGTSREVGLGGSDLALPGGYAATFINPAGLGSRVTTSDIDFGSDSNVTDDFVVDINNPSSRAYALPNKYSYTGFRYIAKSGWGLGAVISQPLAYNDTFLDLTGNRKVNGFQDSFSNADQVNLTSRKYTIAAGRNAFDGRISFGASLDLNRFTEKFDLFSTSLATPTAHVSSTRQTWSANIGLLARPWPWLQVGALYKGRYRIPFDASLNSQLPNGIRWFREAKYPDVFSLGAVWLPRDWLHVFAQSNYVRGISDSVVPGSALFPATFSARVADTQKSTLDFHWGGECIPIDEPDLTIKLWIGGYLENTGVGSGYSRYHRTAGLQLSPWFVDFTMSVDQASLYKNFTVGAGVDLLQVSKRVATFFDWKLPL